MRGVKLPVRRLRRRRCSAARRERREKRGGRIRLRGPRSRGRWRPVLSLAMPGYSRGCCGASGLAPACVLVEPQPSYTPWLARLLHLHKARRRGWRFGSEEKRGSGATRRERLCAAPTALEFCGGHRNPALKGWANVWRAYWRWGRKSTFHCRKRRGNGADVLASPGMTSPAGPKRGLELGQVVVADADAVEGGFGFVVLDEIVLDAGFGAVCEDALPVDGAGADVGEASGEGDGWAGGAAKAAGGIRVADEILYVNQREAAGIFVEIDDRVFTGDADPAEVELHFDELGIEGVEEKIIGKFGAEGWRGFEFERVIVVGELDAGFLAGFAGGIEKIGGAFPSTGFGALFFVNPGANKKFVADGVSGVEGLRPFLFDGDVIAMGGRRGEMVSVEHGANFFWSFVKLAGELDFFVSSGGNFGEGAAHIGLQGVAHGVKLKADGAQRA